jgi:regulator of RNase E activity RraA
LGRAFTAQYLPIRPEVHDVIEADAKAAGRTPIINQRVMDLVGPGDVLVVDIYGKMNDGPFLGENLARSIFLRTGNGVVINGSIRDIGGVRKVDSPIYSRGLNPTVYKDVMLTGVNVPLRLGDVTVMPGDVVVGSPDGVSFVPPHLVEKVLEYSDAMRFKDEWTEMKMKTGKYKSTDLYPAPTDPALKQEYEEWVAERRKREPR